MSSETNPNHAPGLRVAIAGATGAVGEVLLDVLAERAFPVDELRLLASGRSAGGKLRWRDREWTIHEATAEAFEGIDLVFFAATGSLSRDLAPAAVERGAIVIDKSSTWRMDPGVPLVVPEINPEALDAHRGIISCPNCTTIGVVMALAPIEREARLSRVIATTFQAASGAGRDGVDRLMAERAGRDTDGPDVFVAPLHDNVIPLCDVLTREGDSAEEQKLRDELRKILARPDLPVSVTCVRVPVAVGHSASVLVETERALTPERARALIAAFPGIEMSGDPAHVPTARDVVGRDVVGVGRVRRERDGDGLWLWQVADNLRKGAATNAVQIAETLIERKLLG